LLFDDGAAEGEAAAEDGEPFHFDNFCSAHIRDVEDFFIYAHCGENGAVNECIAFRVCLFWIVFCRRWKS
jgi:hypothetical protein